MKRLQTTKHTIYETTNEGLNFLVLIDDNALRTYLYCETEEPGIFYQEDRIWKNQDAVKQADEYINKHIDIIKDGRERYIKFCKNYTEDDGKIFGYPAITTREWLLA